MAGRAVVCTPGVIGGRPRIDGTRIPARTIAWLHFEGYDAEAIRGMYPEVTAGDVAACVAWRIAQRNEVLY